MKSLKIIIPAVILILLALVGFWIWKATDHRAEVRRLIYTGNSRGLDELLTRHPSVANAKNVDLEEKGWTPLHMAAYTGNPEVLQVLLNHHANTEARDKRG